MYHSSSTRGRDKVSLVARRPGYEVRIRPRALFIPRTHLSSSEAHWGRVLSCTSANSPKRDLMASSTATRTSINCSLSSLPEMEMQKVFIACRVMAGFHTGTLWGLPELSVNRLSSHHLLMIRCCYISLCPNYLQLVSESMLPL